MRGLCSESVYNSAYTLTMTREGRARWVKTTILLCYIIYYIILSIIYYLYVAIHILARFLGHYTSSIQFDADTQLWQWHDMKQPSSLATRTGNLGTLGRMRILHFAQLSQVVLLKIS